MGRKLIHPWRDYLTPEERKEVRELDLQLKALSSKIKPIREARKFIATRARKRAMRDEEGRFGLVYGARNSRT